MWQLFLRSQLDLFIRNRKDRWEYSDIHFSFPSQEHRKTGKEYVTSCTYWCVVYNLRITECIFTYDETCNDCFQMVTSDTYDQDTDVRSDDVLFVIYVN